MNAEQAGQAFLDLKAKHFIPMHWGTFNFGNDHFDMPLIRDQAMVEGKSRSRFNDQKLHILQVGGFAGFDKECLLLNLEDIFLNTCICNRKIFGETVRFSFLTYHFLLMNSYV